MRRSGRAGDAQGPASLGDDDESQPRRHLRYVAMAGAVRSRRRRGRRSAVRVMDSRARLRPGDPLADRSRRSGGPGQPGGAGAAAVRGVHASAPGRGTRSHRIAGHALDARDRDVPDADGDGARAEESPGRAGPAAGVGVRVRLPELAGGGGGSVAASFPTCRLRRAHFRSSTMRIRPCTSRPSTVRNRQVGKLAATLTDAARSTCPARSAAAARAAASRWAAVASGPACRPCR